MKKCDLFSEEMAPDQLNACVGENGGPYDDNHYAKGFFSAGDLICKTVIKEGGVDIDCLIYPAFFNYRHGVELALKQIIRNGSKGSASIFKKHSLKELWEIAKEYISEDIIKRGPLEENILKLDKIDSFSTESRYAKSLDGKIISFNKVMRINMQTLFEAGRNLRGLTNIADDLLF